MLKASLLAASCLGVLAWHGFQPFSSPGVPELPRVFLATDFQAPTGRSLTVPAGGNFQAALNQAQPGDEIVLAAGATFAGNFILPAKSASGWITVRSSAMASLPGPGQRVGPGDRGAMPVLETPNGGPALRTEQGTRGWRIMGIEIRAAPAVELNYGLVLLGDGEQTQLAQVPTDLILDRVYIHGHPTLELKRCLALNSASTAVIDSYLSECHIRGFDSQAILGWAGPGPYKIVNNYLEGAGENVMFGGAVPRIQGLIPSDIEIRGNHFYKPLEWKAAKWTVKNLFEIKNGQRVLVEGNVFENNWVHAQDGFAILFQATLNGRNVTWATVRDVTFRYNRITNSAAGINLLSRRPGVTEPSMRISFTHNVLDRIGVDPGTLGSNGRLLQLQGDHQYVTFAHNTAFSTYSALFLAGRGKVGTVFRDNIVAKGRYGIGGNGVGEGLPALRAFDPALDFQGNVIHGGVTPRLYPPGNFYVSSLADVGFVDAARGNYRLRPTSPLRNKATDGTDPGADIALVDKLTGAAVVTRGAAGR